MTRISKSLRISSLPAALGFASCLILVLNLSSRVAARTIDDTQFRSPEQSKALIAGWIAQGERRDFPWEFAVSKPYLSYDQISYLNVTATIPLSELRKKGMGHDLHFIVKIADETGQWLDGRIYRHQAIDSKIPKQFSVSFEGPIAFRPGRFRIAILIYDALTERRNVTFRRVTVHPPGSEPFPELLSRLSRVGLDVGLGTPSRGAPSFPVAMQRPILLDLVIEFSTHVVRKGQLHRLVHTPRVLRPARVLSRLDLENGCIRVTGLDSLNLRTVIPSQPASGLDLETVTERIDAEDKDERMKVSVEELETAPTLEAARYFHNELERIIAAPPPCSFTSTPTSTPPVHVVAILTSGVDFIRGTPRPMLESECNCRIFYLRAVPPFQSVFYNADLSYMLGPDVIPPMGALPKTIPDRRSLSKDPVLRPKSDYDRVQDRLKSIVEPLSPRVFEFVGPLGFRPKFFEFIAALKNLSMED